MTEDHCANALSFLMELESEDTAGNIAEIMVVTDPRQSFANFGWLEAAIVHAHTSTAYNFVQLRGVQCPNVRFAA